MCDAELYATTNGKGNAVAFSESSANKDCVGELGLRGIGSTEGKRSAESKKGRPRSFRSSRSLRLTAMVRRLEAQEPE
jgi:hypothetical protein